MEITASPEVNSAHLRDEHQLFVSSLVSEETGDDHFHKRGISVMSSDEKRCIEQDQGREDLLSDAWIHVVRSSQRCIFHTVCSVF